MHGARIARVKIHYTLRHFVLVFLTFLAMKRIASGGTVKVAKAII
jgi:hypothetical protein